MYSISKRAVTFSAIIGLITFLLVALGLTFKVKALHLVDLLTFNWWMTNYGEPQMTFTGFYESYFTIFAKYFDVPTVVIAILILAAYLAVKKYYSLALWVMYVVASGGLIGLMLKRLFHRARPYDHLLADGGFSFPSGHTLSSSVLFMIVIITLTPKLKNRYVRCIVYTLSAVIWESVMFSRMYFHAHFFTDVLGGMAFGLFWVMFNLLLFNRLDRLVSRFLKNNRTLIWMQ
ncbi:phosphatase PAP2 family protein [Macrococcus brunensis]|uniref:Phosphatase PAP2 family protein n=1 Tax=Macrococcus brunensis TaxID=198483 RepID=A0A4R6BFB1_9STAP|nr:phosphatase PAP2 family protein [Macrococcus brunensis]TDL98514.1 phosphatase PAP2 family protein [Macrococcus brunensis]